MRPTEHAAALWADQLDFRSSPAWKLLSAAPWTVAFLRAEFTQARPRITLDAFHAALDAFLKHLRANGAGLNEQWQAAQYADSWVRSRFLARPLVDGQFHYEPTAQTARVLTFLEDFTGARTNLNSSRLNTLLTSIEALAHETDPDPQARIRQLEAEIAERQDRIRQLQAGEGPAVMPREGAVAAARSVLDLAANLPADFKRMRDGVQEMLHAVRQEIMESSVTKGVAVGQVLEGDRQLRSTPEGETFRGFTEFLNDPAQQARFRQAVTEVLERDFIDELAPTERHTLANLVRELRRQAGEVHSSYGKLSESLHAYVQSDAFRESQLLRKAVRAAELAVANSTALKARTPVAGVGLFAPEFATLATLGIFDPAEHVAPPRLADPPALSGADVVRTPSTPKADPERLRAAVVRARRAAGGTATVGQAFAALEPADRHLNSVRHLVLAARTAGGTVDATAFEPLAYTQVDGTERTAYLPVITFAKDPA
ncbi:hypothetical protein NCCP1664_21270 [Zafaria cholistanensis]|uniref:DUF3375 domain-containing protein n=1 Tax=Zafaria cholistanensis TaxID=1682741 RepID=A0A5A7NU07_9MICC|nr:DUF3375 domain-containing protein [Zafaria cholistanensis]GER23632.1 hypothetical protein NCCP1664_21270 [Zafaria cholistanensis]